MDQMNHKAWEGRTIVDTGCVSLELARQIQATLDVAPAEEIGDPLPPLSHWCAFAPTAPLDNLGADGHPRESELLPPSPLQRRMWAGGSLEFHAPLRVGDPLRRRSTVRSISSKQGAAGDMVFVTVDHAIYGPRGLSVSERQDIVYLQIPDTYVPPKKRPIVGTVLEEIQPSEALLFRFSAITFNAHRIHYDKPYATEVEKYPDLVVHGPLQAMLLMRAAVSLKGRSPKYFDFRGVHPMFVSQRCKIAYEESVASIDLCTGQDDHQCMQANAIWMETQ